MTALAALLSYPSAVRPAELDMSPPVEASELFIGAAATATHAPTIVVPSGLAASKLLIFVVADRQLTGTTLNTTLTPEAFVEANSTTLFGYGLFYDAPPAGTATVSLTFSGGCIPKVLLAVLSGARPGAPFGGASSIDNDRADVLPPARSSTCIDLIAAGQATFWEHPATQTLLDRSEPGGAAASVKRPANPVVQRMEWTADVQPPDSMQIAMAVAPGSQAAPAAFQLISSWAMDETTGTDGVDAQGVAGGTWTAPERGVATIVTGGTGSTGLNGVNSRLDIPYPGAAWLHPSYTVGGYGQVDNLPLVNTHYTIANKETVDVPGGFTSEARNVAGQLRFRAYTRDAAGLPVFFGSADGVVNLTPGVAFLWAIAVDPTDLAQPSKLMVRQAGGAGAVVATSLNTEGLQNNVRPLRWGLHANGQSPLTGVLQAGFLGSGAMTLTEFNALAAPVSISHSSPTVNITVPNIAMGQLAISSVTDIDLADHGATGLAGGALTFTEITDTAARATFVNNGTAAARIRLTMPAAAGAPTNETATFTISEAGGPASNVFQVSWTRPAAAVGGYTPFPYVTVARPANQNLALPDFNATNPSAASFIDPMSGLRSWQILPHHATRGLGNGRMIFANGSNTPYWVKSIQRHQSSPNDTSWNCNDTRLLLYSAGARNLDSQSGGAVTASVMLRTSDWRITHTEIPNVNAMFWDADNPDILWRWTQNSQWFRFNAATNVDSLAFSLAGYTMANTNGGNVNVTNPGRNGYTRKWGGPNVPGAGGPRYQSMVGRRTSDNMCVMFRVRLDNGTKSGDMELGPCVENNNAGTWAVINGQRFAKGVTTRISASGAYCLLTTNGRDFFAFSPPASGSVSLASAHVGNIGVDTGALSASHPDTTIVNGQDVLIGQGTGNPTQITYWNINTNTVRRLASIPDGGNPYTISCQGRLDLAETYGTPVGSGLLTGRRYAAQGKLNGWWLIRTGPNDTDVLRYGGNPRGTHDGDDNLQADPVMSQTGRYVLWASNWRGAGGGVGGSGGPISPYITDLRDAHYSPNNDGS